MLAIVGLGVFALADIALIALALGLISGGADQAERNSASPAASLSAEASPEPTETPAPIPPAAPVLRALAVVDGQVAWRAERGDCETQAVIEVTSDGGATWIPTQPVTTGGREVLWLWAQDADYAQAVVGAGDSCAPTGIRSFTSGDFWNLSADTVGEAAYVASDGTLVTPAGYVSPCTSPTDVTERDDSTAVLCADGTVHETSDGVSWASAAVPGAVAFVAAGEDYVVAVQQTPSCGGMALVTLPVPSLGDGVAASEPRACLSGSIDPAATVVSAGGDSVWLWSGSEVGMYNFAQLAL